MPELMQLSLGGEPPRTEAAALDRLRAIHRERAGVDPAVIVRAPGRVNLIGEHIDYHGGPVLPAAVSLAIYVAASRRDDDARRLRSLDDPFEVETRPAGRGPSADSMTLPRWALYPLGVVEGLEMREPFDSGVDVTYVATLPKQKGLSSSAALEVGTALALSELFGRPTERRALAQLVQEAESRSSGVRCGIMDMLAILAGKAGHATLIDCTSLATRHVRLPTESFAIVVCDSGKARALAAVAYNKRRDESMEALDDLERATGIAFMGHALTHEVLAAAAPRLESRHRRRLAHVVSECERVRRCVAALEAGDMKAVSELFVQSHRSLRFDYEVSTPELDALVMIAREMHPLVCARLTGAGFGGSTVNLVPREALERFLAEVPRRYAEKFPKGPACACFVVEPTDGASRIA
jgi:galactokinase